MCEILSILDLRSASLIKLKPPYWENALWKKIRKVFVADTSGRKNSLQLKYFYN